MTRADSRCRLSSRAISPRPLTQRGTASFARTRLLRRMGYVVRERTDAVRIDAIAVQAVCIACGTRNARPAVASTSGLVLSSRGQQDLTAAVVLSQASPLRLITETRTRANASPAVWHF